MPTTTVVGGVPESLIAAAEVPVAVGGADELDEPELAPDGELSPPPHPDSRAEILKQTSMADRNPSFLAANIRRLNDGR